jgi:type IV secretion system protein VirB9
MTLLMPSRRTLALFALAALAAPVSPVAAAGPRARAGADRIAAVRTATRAATVEPASSDFLNAATVYAFSDGAVFHVYTAPGRVTDVALQPGEALVSVASGDTVRWVIGDTSSGSKAARRVHVLVKPVAAGLATNLVIATDKRTYHLALTSSAEAAMAALSWTYPHDDLIAIQGARTAAEAAAPVAAGLDATSLNFAYAIDGDRPAWRPLRAFDDGRRTYIEFPASLALGEAPPLFLVESDGKLGLVNYRVRGRFYVVDRLFGAAELRLGAGKQQQVVRITRGADEARSRHGRRR